MSKDPKSKYYDAGGIETLDILKAKSTTEEYMAYCKLVCIKYLCRANFKGHPERDMEKCAFYMKEHAEAQLRYGKEVQEKRKRIFKDAEAKFRYSVDKKDNPKNNLFDSRWVYSVMNDNQ